MFEIGTLVKMGEPFAKSFPGSYKVLGMKQVDSFEGMTLVYEIDLYGDGSSCDFDAVFIMEA